MSQAVRRALYGKLAGDSTLTNLLASPPTGYAQNIWHQQAHDAADHPFVIFQKQSGTPRYALGARAYDNELWLVKGVVRKSDSAAQSADDVADAISSRLNALLTDGTISISGSTQLYLRRESDIEYTETSEGQPRILHAGALYRLMYQ